MSLERAEAGLRALAEQLAAAAEPAALAALRRAGREGFASLGLPDTRLEEWRYTSLQPLAALEPVLAAGDAPASRQALEAHSFPVFACGLFVFVDGRYRPELSSGAVAEDAEVESLAALRTRDPERLAASLGVLADAKRHPFVALNTALLDDGACIRIPERADLEHPIHLVFATSGRAGVVVSPRVKIEAGAGSRAVVIQDHVDLQGGEPTLTNAVTEIQVGANASLDHVLLQREHEEALHFSHTASHQERDAQLRLHTIKLGGRLVRNDLAAVLAGEGADCVLMGLSLGSDDQLRDDHTLVDHAVPHCRSHQLYKGVLGGRSRGVFRGRVIVRPDAQKTDARQSNRNLLLSDGAEIDSKPQLEIYADDVKCSHGSAIGRVDDDALFYLRSRGVAEADARALLTRGFAAEILEALPGDALGPALADVFAERLLRAGAGA